MSHLLCRQKAGWFQPRKLLFLYFLAVHWQNSTLAAVKRSENRCFLNLFCGASTKIEKEFTLQDHISGRYLRLTKPFDREAVKI